MFVVARQYQVDPGVVGEIARRAEEGFVAAVSAVPGFIAYTIVDYGGGAITSVGVFDDKSAADESTARVGGWVRANFAALVPNPPRVMTGEVRLRDVRSGQVPTYAVSRQFSGVDPADHAEIVRRVGEGLLPILRDIPGYVAYLALDLGEGNVGSVSMWADRAAAEEANRRSDAFRDNRSTLVPNPPRVHAGTILIRHTND